MIGNIPVLTPFDPFIPELYERKTHLLDAFERVGALVEHTKLQARELFDLLPIELRGTTVAWSRIDQDWCYHFGEPYDRLPNNTFVIGTPQIPRVRLLYRTLMAVRHYLSKDDQLRICQLLSQRAKHADYLEEIAPLLRLDGPAVVQYEVTGGGGRTIDFLITAPGKQPVLLEVKNRHKDLLHHLGHFTSNEAVGRGEDDIPPPEPAWLFPSVIDKFPSCPSRRVRRACGFMLGSRRWRPSSRNTSLNWTPPNYISPSFLRGRIAPTS